MTTKTREEVAQVSGQVRDYIKVNNSLPTLITFNNGEQVNQATFLRMMSVAIAQLQTGDTTPILTTPYNNPSQGNDNVTSGKQWSRKNYTNFAYDTKEHYAVYKSCPTMHGTPFGELSFYGIIWTLSRVLGWYWDNPDKLPVRTLPAYVTLENKFKAVNTTPTVTKSQYVQAFQGAVGKTIDTYTQGYNAIKNRIYLKYFNDVYKVDVALQRLKDKSGLNCADIVQLMYQLGLDLGYQVRVVHIVCQSGTGHMQLDIKGKEFGDTWKRHDPAKALSDGGDLGTLWCANGTVISYNDDWMLSDDGIT